MAINLLQDRGTPLERQRFTWKELAPRPISKLDDDAFTRVRGHALARPAWRVAFEQRGRTTQQAIGVLADFGYFPVQAAQVGRRAHAKHMLAFSQHNGIQPLEGRPELILYNSHDGTSALKLFAGFFRFICSNGIVAGEGFKSRMLHNTSTVRNFETLITSTAARLDDLQSNIDNMRSKTMSEPDALEFIRHGATFRWAEDRITDNTIADIYQPRRDGDTSTDVWSIYNRLQESMIRGGVRVGPEDRKARRQLEHAVVEYGNAIKDLVAANIFPGDMLWKNFGVTRNGKVVFYDYDEIEYITDCQFRRVPAPRTEEDEMSGEIWYSVGPKDVFPETFGPFLLGNSEVREVFMKHHGDLLDVQFWQSHQQRIQARQVIDVFPYDPERRFAAQAAAGSRTAAARTGGLPFTS